MKIVGQTNEEYLLPTAIIDSDHETIIENAMDIVADAGKDSIAKAIKLYYAVRDGIHFSRQYPFYLPEHYRASNVLKHGSAFCIPI